VTRTAGLLLPLVLLAQAAFPAGAPEDLFREGNLAYQEGRFEDAAARYEEVRTRDLASGPLHYNLGNAYYRLGDLGRAMANYQRALRYLPRDEDLRANIEFVRTRTLDRSMAGDRFPLLALLGSLAGRLTWREWLVAWEIAYAALLLVGALFLFRAPSRSRLRGPLQGAAVLFVLLTLFLGRAVQEQAFARKAAVIPGETSVRSGPGTRFTEEFVLHQGTVLRVHREAEGWALVSVSPDLKGWVSSDSLERI
jgi:tetratricopeptide (TPR) repeat protein